MKLAASKGIASMITDDIISVTMIMPDPLDADVPVQVATAVATKAIETHMIKDNIQKIKKEDLKQWFKQYTSGKDFEKQHGPDIEHKPIKNRSTGVKSDVTQIKKEDAKKIDQLETDSSKCDRIKELESSLNVKDDIIKSLMTQLEKKKTLSQNNSRSNQISEITTRLNSIRNEVSEKDALKNSHNDHNEKIQYLVDQVSKLDNQK